MFKELPEGQTHYYGDECGESEHNKSQPESWEQFDTIVRDLTAIPPRPKSEVRQRILSILKSERATLLKIDEMCQAGLNSDNPKDWKLALEDILDLIRE